jgi:hypothetical protein
VEWIHLAQNRDRCRAVVNAVMNLRVLAPLSFSFNLQLTAVHTVILCYPLLPYSNGAGAARGTWTNGVWRLSSLCGHQNVKISYPFLTINFTRISHSLLVPYCCVQRYIPCTSHCRMQQQRRFQDITCLSAAYHQ